MICKSRSCATIGCTVLWDKGSTFSWFVNLLFMHWNLFMWFQVPSWIVWTSKNCLCLILVVSCNSRNWNHWPWLFSLKFTLLIFQNSPNGFTSFSTATKIQTLTKLKLPLFTYNSPWPGHYSGKACSLRLYPTIIRTAKDTSLNSQAFHRQVLVNNCL